MQYRFAEFVLDVETERVTGPDGALALRRRTFLLLRSLVEHAPSLVTRDQILDDVWGHDALSPNVLPQTISELRQAFNDNAQSPRLIETRHRRGYRLMVPVERVDTGANVGVVPLPVALEPVAVAVSPGLPVAPSSPRRLFARVGVTLVLLIAVGLAGMLLLRGGGTDSSEAAARPALAIALSSGGDVPEWLAGAGVELLAVALASDDRMQLLRGDGRSGQQSGTDARWQVWMREVLGADYALTGVWQSSPDGHSLNYSLVRLDDGRIALTGEARDRDLAALCRAVAATIRADLRLIEANDAWLAQLPHAGAPRDAYYRGLAALDQGRAGDAIAALEQAAAAEDAGDRVQLALANAYRIGGRLAQAREQFARVLAAGKDLSVGERLRIEAESALLDYRNADAAASFTALHRLMPDDSDIALSLVDAQLNARQTTAAQTTLASLGTLESGQSEDPRFHLAKARLAGLQQDVPARRAAAEQALALAERFSLDELAAQAQLELAQTSRTQGDLAGARTRLQALLEQPVAAVIKSQAQLQLGSLMRDLGDFAAADTYLADATAGFTSRGDRAGELRTQIERHTIDSERGHSEGAQTELLALEPAVVELGDAMLLARYFNTLGVQAVRNNRVDDANQFLQRAASESRRAGQPAQEAGAYTNLGMLLARNRRFTEAQQVWEKALQVFRDTGDRLGEAITLGNLASLMRDHADQARGREMNLQALELMRGLGAQQHIARTAYNLALGIESDGDLRAAAALFEEALVAYRAGAGRDPVLNVVASLVRVRLALAEIGVARTLLESVASDVEKVTNPLGRSHIAAAWGNLELLAGNFETARASHREALALRTQSQQEAWQWLSELDQLNLDLVQGRSAENVRAGAERIAARQERAGETRDQMRAHVLEISALLRLGRRDQARKAIEAARGLLATRTDAALTHEIDRLRILASADPPAARHAGLLVLAQEASTNGFVTFALRCRLDAMALSASATETHAVSPVEEIRLAGLDGLLKIAP